MENSGTPSVITGRWPRHGNVIRPRVPRGGFRLAAIDIDDTLLGPDWQISAENLEAVRALQRRGIHVVLASGRSHLNMLRFHQALGLGDGPVISAQGAVVRPAAAGAPWLEQTIEPGLVARVTREGIERGFAVQHYRGDEILVQRHSQWTEFDQSRNDVPQRFVDDLVKAAAADARTGVVKIIWLGDPTEIAANVADAVSAYGRLLTVIPTDPPYLEFYDLGADKGVALAAVAERLKVTRSQTLAFGDGNNDVPMLAWAGIGVAMDHAKLTAQRAAPLVAPSGDPRTSLARAVRLVLEDGAGAPVAADDR